LFALKAAGYYANRFIPAPVKLSILRIHEMTSGDEKATVNKALKLNYDTMSIDDLHEYIAEMAAEIEKIKLIIEKKVAAQNTADSFFRK
jgi:uncharacterized small protein (DUF1192 family)